MMAVYVDKMMASLGRMKMCHMVADSTEELLAMASVIGLDPRWLQNAGTAHEHFDISMGKRRLAITAGAIEVDRRWLGAIFRRLCESLERAES